MGSPAKWVIAAKRSYAEYDVAEKILSQSQLKDKDLKREWEIIERERVDSQNQVIRRLQIFKNLVDQIKMKITDQPLPYDKPSKETLASLLEQFEGKLANFKLNMRMEFDKFEEEEQTLTHEVTRVDALVESILAEEMQHLLVGGEVMNPAAVPNKDKWKQQKQRQQEDLEHKAAIGEIDKEVNFNFSFCFSFSDSLYF